MTEPSPPNLVDEEALRQKILNDPMVRRAVAIADQVDRMEIKDPNSCDAAASALAVMRGGINAVDRYSKESATPFREAAATVRAIARSISDPLKSYDALLDQRITTWRKTVEMLSETAREEARKVAEQAVAEEGTEAPAVEEYIPPTPKIIDTPHGTVVARKRWTFKIDDPAAVPRPFCEPSGKLIMDAVRRGVRHIPGVTIFQEDDLAVRDSR